MSRLIILLGITLSLLNYSIAQKVTDSCIIVLPILSDSLLCKLELDSQLNRNVVYFPEIEASFQGGAKKMMDFINTNIQYIDPAGHFGTVYTYFLVEANGEITNIQIKRGVNKELDKSALDVISKMPKWIPAKCDDQAVPSVIMIPIKFH